MANAQPTEGGQRVQPQSSRHEEIGRPNLISPDRRIPQRAIIEPRRSWVELAQLVTEARRTGSEPIPEAPEKREPIIYPRQGLA